MPGTGCVPNVRGRSSSARYSEDANLVRIFVKTIRRKLGEDAAKPEWIFNERGVGYRMAEPGAD